MRTDVVVGVTFIALGLSPFLAAHYGLLAGGIPALVGGVVILVMASRRRT